MKSKAIKRQRWHFDFYNQWLAFFERGMNWYDFTFVKVFVEYTPYEGSCSLELGLLGFCMTLTYRYNFDFIDELDAKAELIARLQDEHPGMEIKDPFGELDKITLSKNDFDKFVDKNTSKSE